MQQTAFDIVIVGAGIVGLATALELSRRHPSLRLAILEKEAEVARHQTGHNSGVIHAGIYYRPGSLKARLSVQGAQRMKAFCDQHGIRWERCGKVVVATSDAEIAGLEELYRRGTANGVEDLRLIGREELRQIEPHAAGVAALHSPNTGIVDYGEVARAMEGDLRRQGVQVFLGRQMLAVHQGPGLQIETAEGTVATSYLINAAGLYSDVIARQLGAATDVRIIPFRGEYYFLRPERQSLVRGLIYPVVDPALPFLGVHFTRTVHGRVEAGPNAVLALAREGYSHWAINPTELLQTLAYPGFWRLARRFWHTGLDEFRRSFSKLRFARSLQRLVPAIQPDDLIPGGSGVRAQAVGPDGALLDDFVIADTPHAIHVLNAPSPAATASLAIGEYIAGVATNSFHLE